MFFVPTYSSQMNPIELEWQHLQKDELCGQISDLELVKAAGGKGNCSTQRVKFNSNHAG